MNIHQRLETTEIREARRSTEALSEQRASNLLSRCFADAFGGQWFLSTALPARRFEHFGSGR